MSFAAELHKMGLENEEVQKVPYFLSTGYPPLDKIIAGNYHSGGFPAGRVIEIFGPESSGKTAIATKIMVAAQQMGGVGCFMDHEHSFDIDQAQKQGLRTSPEHWVYRKPLTFEKSIDEAEKIIATIRKHIPDKYIPIVIVFDSLVNMIPESKWEKDKADYNMNDHSALARATANCLPSFTQRCEVENVTAIFLNQIREKIGVVYGDPTSTPGGRTMKFQASTRLKLNATKLKDKDEIVGQRVTCETWKNKVSRPFQKVTWDFLFKDDGSGSFERVSGTLDEVIKVGALVQSGPRVTWTDGKSYFKSVLAKKIEEEGLWDELVTLLPSDKEEAA